MRFFLFVCTALMITSCRSLVSTAVIRDEAVMIRTALMKNESSSTGAFITTREFHLGMMQETTRPDVYPYTSLDSLFGLMRSAADSIILSRIQFDPDWYTIDSVSASTAKISLEESKTKYDGRLAEGRKLLAASDFMLKRFEQIQSGYTELKENTAIRRMEQGEYAVLLNKKLLQWQDSLEQTGRLLGAEKRDLRQKYPVQKGSEFFAHYRYVSDLEAAIKAFESSITQLENSLSRIEGGNSAEFYYFGPYIPSRREVEATDGILGQLAIQMADCRALSAGYWNSYP